ncbi:ATP synthase complex assembly protein atp12 [Blyttiomyces sp. JEL0837]|nr:ATP synthase complex assembly protein atp12 [Blyttiomyces sp. JEL0837]
MLTAAEWECQEKLLKSTSLPVTSLVVRGYQSINAERDRVIELLLKYLTTDSVCFFQEEPAPLVELQSQYWEPLIKWFNEEFGVKVEQTYGFSLPGVEENKQKMKAVLESLTDIELAAVERATVSSKSLIIAMAILKRAISTEFAVAAARVEVDAQIKKWGEVLDAHDIDTQNLKKELGSVTSVLSQ